MSEHNSITGDKDHLLNNTYEPYSSTSKIDNSSPEFSKPHIAPLQKAPPPLHAMSPIAASATIVNLILATGPFS